MRLHPNEGGRLRIAGIAAILAAPALLGLGPFQEPAPPGEAVDTAESGVDGFEEESPAEAPRGEWKLEQRSYPPGVDQLVGITGRESDAPVQVAVTLDGVPVQGEIVEFRVVASPSGAGGTSLSSERVETDADGMARTRLTIGDAEGDYTVAAYLHGSLEHAEHVVTTYRAMGPEWIVLMVIGLVGGLGLFLFGMNIAGDHLQKLAGTQIRKLMKKLTSNRWSGLLVGTAASAALQSSSAAAVMVVGFVSATMMTMSQAIAVIIGTKVGVTITLQLIAFDISKYALGIVGTGAILIIGAGRRETLKHVGSIVLGFGLIFFGLSVMSGTMKPLRGMPEFANLLLTFAENPALAILAAAGFTAVIQSVAAMVAMSMALAVQGLLPLEGAIPLAIGGSIGTCTTALLASIGGSRDGLRVAVAHLVFSIVAAVVFFPFLGWFTDGIRIFTSWLDPGSPAREIANGFMFYSIVTAVLFMPFVGLLDRAVRRMIPDAKGEEKFGPRYINEAALGVPVLALEQATREVERMGNLLCEILEAAGPAVRDGERQEIARVDEEIEKLVVLEEAIRPFLARVLRKELPGSSEAQARALVYITEHLVGAGHLLSKEVLEPATEMLDSGHRLSEKGAAEIESYHGKIASKCRRVAEAVEGRDRAKAEMILQLGFKEKRLERKLRDAHLGRLQAGDEEEDASSGDHLSILAGLGAVGHKLGGIAEEISREL